MNAETAAGEARCTGIFASHTDWVTGLAVAARRILASSSNDGTLKLWDLAAAQRTSGSHLRGPPGGDGDDVGAAQEGEDGRREGTQHARGIANGDRIRSGVENGAEKWRAIGGLEGEHRRSTSGSNACCSAFMEQHRILVDPCAYRATSLWGMRLYLCRIRNKSVVLSARIPHS